MFRIKPCFIFHALIIFVISLKVASVKSITFGVRFISKPGNEIIHSAPCEGLPKGFSPSKDETEQVIGAEGPLFTQLEMCEIPVPETHDNFTFVFAEFDNNTCPLRQIIGTSESAGFKAIILMERKSVANVSTTIRNSSLHAFSSTLNIYPCLISQSDNLLKSLNSGTNFTARFDDTIPTNFIESFLDWIGKGVGVSILVVAGFIGLVITLFAAACVLPIMYWVTKQLVMGTIWVTQKIFWIILHLIVYTPVYAFAMGYKLAVLLKEKIEGLELGVKLGLCCTQLKCRLSWTYWRIRQSQMTCTICREDLVTRESTMTLHCAHVFHTECITPWLRRAGNCPICRNVEPASRSENSPLIPGRTERIYE